MNTLNENTSTSFSPITISKTNAQDQVLQAETLVEKGDYPAALKIYHELLDTLENPAPVHFDVFKNMGNIYLKCGDIEAAEEKYNQANALNSDDESLIINYGVLEIQKGEFSKAKERFAQVIAKNDTSDIAWVGLAIVHRAYTDNELSIACLLRGLDENAENKLALSNYYQWCQQDGVDADTSFLTQYLEKHPGDQEIAKIAHGLNQ